MQPSKKSNIEDFDYSLLKPLINKFSQKEENVILLTTGSFNPIHRMHL